MTYTRRDSGNMMRVSDLAYIRRGLQRFPKAVVLQKQEPGERHQGPGQLSAALRHRRAQVQGALLAGHLHGQLGLPTAGARWPGPAAAFERHRPEAGAAGGGGELAEGAGAHEGRVARASGRRGGHMR